MRGTTEKAADILMRRIDGARRILARAGVERGKLETMIEAALRERDAARREVDRLLSKARQERDEARAVAARMTGIVTAVLEATDAHASPETLRHTTGPELAAHIADLRADVGNLTEERDRLRGALRELADAEQHYRRMHDRHGSDSLDTGRAWVQMRRAGDAARAALAGEGEPTPHFPDEHGDCPSWCVGCQSAPPRRCFFPRCRCVSPSLGDCKGEKHSAPEVELPTDPGREGPCAACPHSGSEHLQFSGLCTECDCVEHEAIEVQP